LRFGQDRDLVTSDFSPELVDLHGAKNAHGAQQGVGIKKPEVRTCGKAKQQEQNPHNEPNLWNAMVKLVGNQHGEMPSEVKSNQIMVTHSANVPYTAHKMALPEKIKGES
jgi:hypothetical protein